MDIEVFVKHAAVIGQNPRITKEYLDEHLSSKFMTFNEEKVAQIFFELAGHQRLSILKILSEKNLNIAKMAKKLEATSPEVHRNVGKLSSAGLIVKNPDGNYQLTTFGKSLLIQIPSIIVLSENKKYFNEHTLENLEPKFIQRIGQIQNKKHIKGFVRVLEKWKKDPRRSRRIPFQYTF